MSLRKYIKFFIQKHKTWQIVTSTYSTAAANGPQLQVRGTMKNMEKSIASKGFLRSQKSYSPGSNIVEAVHAICDNLKIPKSIGYKLKNLEEKFRILDACYKNFQHSVPNSQVHEMQSIDDVVQFYETPVNTTTPYDALKTMDLPENLHIQYDYLRYHPDTDTKFKGQTAFPKSSTLVTGLKYRGKYEGHEAKRSWP
ncbi:large ribosomal subunit protein mL50 [Eurosta solidaginis]|uniref:large ribosomal subunit protein mL50 n=1 Tax=Eurosta solidaginis TaxID=178769 RepID=UPI00353097A2